VVNPVTAAEDGTSHHNERVKDDSWANAGSRQESANGAGLDFYDRFTDALLASGEGFHQRFGLVHVDHDTQARTPKASYQWYRDLIAAQRH
jgi:beta-glucosidase